jgi:hypothetical protein
MNKKITVNIRRAKLLSSEIMCYEVTIATADKKAELCFLGEKSLENYVTPLQQMAETAGFEIDIIWE